MYIFKRKFSTFKVSIVLTLYPRGSLMKGYLLRERRFPEV